MKFTSDIKRLLTLAVIALVLVPAVCHAEGKNYFYDDSGTLVRSVTQENEAAIYEYDDTGNLLRIRTTTIEAAPPELYGISPEIMFIGTTASFTITGTNLFTVSAMTSDNPDIDIAVSAADDTSITGRIDLLSADGLGLTNITVTTHYGTASIPITVARVRLEPVSLSLLNGASAEIFASIEPGVSQDVSIAIENQAPGVIEVPESVVIPAGGSAAFTVSALSEGPGMIRAENALAMVFVSQPFEEPLTATSTPVSVEIMPSPWGVVSGQVSVEIMPSPWGAVSGPVSVEIMPSPWGAVSGQVSVEMQGQ
jgi:YD repeat-containing protein